MRILTAKQLDELDLTAEANFLYQCRMRIRNQISLCESPIERIFLEHWSEESWPNGLEAVCSSLECQHWIGEYRVDFAWPGSLFVLEVEGHQFHSKRYARTRDAIRQREIQLAGWTIMRATGTEMVRDPWGVCFDIKCWLYRKHVKEKSWPEFASR